MYKVLPKTRRWTPADAVTGNIYVENGEVKNSRAGSIVRQMESARIDPGVFEVEHPGISIQRQFYQANP
jgi:hypothetical protein